MSTSSDETRRIQEVYNTQYRRDPSDRSYMWHPRNPISLYYRQAQERALIRLLNDFDIPIEMLEILDVGCGMGGLLRFFASLGSHPDKLHGLDLMEYRIEQARRSSPAAIDFQIGTGEALPYPDHSFDLISQFTVFSSILEDQMRLAVAGEMVRVLKPGGFILWYDMRSARSATTRGLEADEIRQLFNPCKLLALRGLHFSRASRMARRSVLLCDLLDWFPIWQRTHFLALFQKPG